MAKSKPAPGPANPVAARNAEARAAMATRNAALWKKPTTPLKPTPKESKQ